MSRQARDSIKYNKTRLTLKYTYKDNKDEANLSPLDFLKDELGVSLSPIQLRSGNYRGYTCRWEIIDDDLYLIQFDSKSYRIYTFEQFLGITPPDEENARTCEVLFPPDEIHHRAQWFSGTIIAYGYRAKRADELNGWEFKFDHGRLINAKACFITAPEGFRYYLEEYEDEEADRINGCHLF